jgi:glutathione synthase
VTLVLVLNRPASLRAWNKKLGSLRFAHLMAPTLVSSQVADLAAFARDRGEVVLKTLGAAPARGWRAAAARHRGSRPCSNW